MVERLTQTQRHFAGKATIGSEAKNSEHEEKNPVIAAESMSEPKQPSRFEKKKNMLLCRTSIHTVL
jgi:hypothetical protein